MRPDLQRLVASLPAAAIARVTSVGLTTVPELDETRWQELLGLVAQLTRSAAGTRQTLTSWLGDILVHGRAPRRGQIVQCAAVTGLNPGTLRNAMMVCRRIPLSRRRDTLTWSHHCEIGTAFSNPADIDRWLDLSIRDSLPIAELRRRIRGHLAKVKSNPGSVTRVLPFLLLRDLRTAARTVEQLRDVWRRWPQPTASLALEEIQALTGFVDDIRRRAMPPSPINKKDVPFPRDLSSN
jgi:hypothetical protein